MFEVGKKYHNRGTGAVFEPLFIDGFRAYGKRFNTLRSMPTFAIRDFYDPSPWIEIKPVIKKKFWVRLYKNGYAVAFEDKPKDLAAGYAALKEIEIEIEEGEGL